jgi:hypothetical protein
VGAPGKLGTPETCKIVLVERAFPRPRDEVVVSRVDGGAGVNAKKSEAAKEAPEGAVGSSTPFTFHFSPFTSFPLVL